MANAEKEIELTYNLLDTFKEINDQITEEKEYKDDLKKKLKAEYDVQPNARATRNRQFISMQTTNIIQMMNNISALISKKADLKLKINDQMMKLQAMSSDEEGNDMGQVMSMLIAKISNLDQPVQLNSTNNLVDDGKFEFVDEQEADQAVEQSLLQKEKAEEEVDDVNNKKIFQQYQDALVYLKDNGIDAIVYDDKQPAVVYYIGGQIVELGDVLEPTDENYQAIQTYLKDNLDKIKMDEPNDRALGPNNEEYDIIGRPEE